MRALRAAIAAALLTAAGCSSPPPSVIVIVIDTLRADHVGSYGYGRPTSPKLDRLAASGYVFDNAIAQSSWTTPSIGSLFTSTYPSVHGACTFTSALPASLETLATAFGRRGYQTAGISANFVHVTRAKGFAAGFDTFAELKREARGDEEAEILGLLPADAAEVTNAALQWLYGRPPGPLFLYLHYMDPHSGYQPPEPYRGRFAAAGYSGPMDGSTEQLKRIARGEQHVGPADRQRLVDLYDGEIAFADEQIGRLLDYLDSTGLATDSYVIVLSDHGEELLDHGRVFHGSTLYREVIRVPLIIRPPGGAPDARRLRQVVQLIDLGPTILALTGEPDSRPTQGRSFASLLGAGAISSWPGLAYSELFEDPLVDAQLYTKIHIAALTTERLSYLARRDGGAELYDPQTDPAENASLAATEGEGAAEAARGLSEHVAACEAFSRLVGKVSDPMTPEQREQLRALGYLR
jgi:arylsulfatase A-like enzyme